MTVNEVDRSSLLSLIQTKEGVVRYYPEGIDLSSGQKSNYYFDLRKITEDPEGINLIAKIMLRKLEPILLRVDTVGGLESGAIPIITSLVQKSYESEVELEGFWVRKKPKEHGDKSMISGNLREGDNVLMVDDSATTGSSFVKTAKEVRANGAIPVAAFSVLDRGAVPTLEMMGIPYSYIFSEEEVLSGMKFSNRQ